MSNTYEISENVDYYFDIMEDNLKKCLLLWHINGKEKSGALSRL